MKPLLFIASILIAQGSFGQLNFTNSNFLQDGMGQPLFEKAHINIEGSPMYPRKWCTATIVMPGNKAYPKVSLRYDWERRIWFFPGKEADTELEIIGVPEKVEFDKNCDGFKELSGLLKSGYPAIDKNDKNTFYIVLAEGKISLLKSYKIKATDSKPYGSASVIRTYTRQESYYIYKEGQMFSLQKNNDAFIELLKDQQEQLKSYMTQKKKNVKQEKDMLELVQYYNQL